ncbi:MAG: CoA pyrophosphatase [Thiolinea sp.]
MHDLDQLSEQEIAKRLTHNTKLTYDIPLLQAETQYRLAGVLIPFIRVDDSWHLLFIRRAEARNDRHSGQVAFAGGGHEQHDKDLFDTALREAHEEIGIAPEDVRILGHLNHHHSVSNYRITPVVGHIPWPYSLKLQTSEVQRAFSIPLHWLADPANHEIRYRELPQNKQRAAIAYFREYDGEILWGATARMTLSLLECLRRDSPECQAR